MRKILLCFGFIALAASPCFAKEHICPDAEQLLNSNLPLTENYANSAPQIRSYKANGKIEFLKACPNGGLLCKTGAYIIAGDYFIAIPKVNDYYCAAYIPNGYKRPKAVGLIKAGNFTETPLNEYNALLGNWQSETRNVIKTIGPYMMQGEADYKDESMHLVYGGFLAQTIILKTGPDSYVSNGFNGIFDIKLQGRKAILNNYEADKKNGAEEVKHFSGTYSYIGPVRP